MFVGRHTRSINATRRVRLPSDYVNRMRRAGDGRVLLVPNERCVFLFPCGATSREDDVVGMLTRGEHLVSRDLRRAMQGRRASRADPVIAPPQVPRTLQEVNASIESACDSTPARRSAVSGRLYEDIVRGALRQHGAEVRSRVSLVGGEADLLLIELPPRERLRFIVIECKYRSTAGGPVGVSPVLRLYGLRQALRDDGVNAGALLVTTADFSSNATVFSRARGVSLRDHAGLLEWSELQADSWRRARWPFHESRRIGAEGAIHVPSSFSAYVASGGGSMMVAGSGRFLQLWIRAEYEALARAPWEFSRAVAEAVAADSSRPDI